MKTKRLIKKIASIGTIASFLGATMLGGLAQTDALNLGNYPQPFISKNGIPNLTIVTGSQASASDTIAQSILLTNLQTKAISSVSENQVLTTKELEKSIRLGNSLTDNGEFNKQLTDTDIKKLQDTEINFKNSKYDIQEVIGLIDIRVETSLTVNDEDYAENVSIEYPRDSIKAFYKFDEAIDLSEVTSTDPLDITFLGKELSIIDVVSNTKFTALIIPEKFMEIGDKVEIDGKEVVLDRVGENGAVIVKVLDREKVTTETIPASSTRTVEGIEIRNQETFYDKDIKYRSATLVIGNNVIESYSDGDAFIGESKNNPKLVWNIENLLSNTATVIDDNLATTGVTIGIENDNVVNDLSDNPPMVGECIKLPDNYVNLCFDSLSNEDYMTLEIEYENSADLSNANSTLTSEKTIFLHTSDKEGLRLVNSGKVTDKVWIFGAESEVTEIYYKDENNKVVFDSFFANDTLTNFVNLNFENTKGNDLKLSYQFDETDGVLELDEDVSEISSDKLTMNWKLVNGEVRSLGNSENTEEAGELVWNGNNIGTKTKNLRMKYGSIIDSPDSNGASDKVELKIPSDLVEAKISMGSKVTGTSSSGVSSGIVNPISSDSVLLAEEVINPQDHNLIVVGGSAVNPLAKSLFGLNVEDFKPNEAIIKLAKNGNNVAMLVAGYSAVDTRNAGEFIVNKGFKGIDKDEIKIVSETQIVGSYKIKE